MASDRGSEQPEAPLDQAIVEAVVELRLLPFIVFANWCNMMSAPWLPAVPRPAHSDTAEQLTVPEPIEETGERALFA